jgi:hypothetical protein
VVAAVAVVAVGAGVAQAQFGQDRAESPNMPSDRRSTTPTLEPGPVAFPPGRVLVTSSLVGTDYAPPVGDEWSQPLGKSGVKTYPYWASVDPDTRRFLVNADGATGLEVMRLGREDPLVRIECDDNGTGCLGATLGPGPDELTMVTGDLTLAVAGPDGKVSRDLGASGEGLLNRFAWSPDGTTLAMAHSQSTADTSTLELVLRRPDAGADTVLYEYAEPAPAWYDAEEHRFGDGPGAFNSWTLRLLSDLQWAPDSTRLAFTTVTSPAGGSEDERTIDWQLFVADVATGEVEQIADLGRCTEPVGEDGRHGGVCEQHGHGPSLTWTPDGKGLTVLADATLTTYDLTGEVLGSQPTEILGPIVWMTVK